eukprot:scaffold61103_cov38-Attheya_sp.AAC.4
MSLAKLKRNSPTQDKEDQDEDYFGNNNDDVGFDVLLINAGRPCDSHDGRLFGIGWRFVEIS